MYKISTQLYLEIADKLMASIGSKEFFSGKIRLTDGDTECTLICTLIVEHDHKPTEGRCFNAISALIPVWWEFHTIVDGEEQINDFSFREFIATIF